MSEEREEFLDRLKVETETETETENNKTIITSKEFKPSFMERRQAYNHYVNSQEPYFMEYRNYINELLCIIKDAGLLSRNTAFTARIKSFKSAVTNDSEKALNDIFGIEVDYGFTEEQQLIDDVITATLNKTKETFPNKENVIDPEGPRYIAHHYSGWPNITGEQVADALNKKLQEGKAWKTFTPQALKILLRNLTEVEKNFQKAIATMLSKRNETKDNLPIIEAQLKTWEVALAANAPIENGVSHFFYKNISIEEIQREYDKQNIDFDALPQMWKSEILLDEDGIPVTPRLLNEEEVMQVMYPGIALNKYKSPRSRGEQK